MDSADFPMRVNKFIARATGMSRREADNAIIHNQVLLNNTPADMGARVHENDTVTLSGKTLSLPVHHTYIMLNKPVGYLCSRRLQGGVPTIYELLPKKYHLLKSVGRLDKDSSGLIILTNDGDFTHRMTHPSFHKIKIYEIELDTPLQPLHQQMISDHGITLEDGTSKLIVERLSETNTQAYRVTMHEGRNRQIRRTFAALGYTVTKLHRVTFGSYSLGDIKTGEHTLVDIHSVI